MRALLKVIQTGMQRTALHLLQRASNLEMYFVNINNMEFYLCTEAGFNQEWQSTTNERSRTRQIEVQANVDNNPNRSTEYRTVPAPDPQFHAEFEAEERNNFYIL